jgi:hypothetical protein
LATLREQQYRHAWSQAVHLSERIEPQPETVEIVIAHSPSGTPGGEHVQRPDAFMSA